MDYMLIYWISFHILSVLGMFALAWYQERPIEWRKLYSALCPCLAKKSGNFEASLIILNNPDKISNMYTQKAIITAIETLTVNGVEHVLVSNLKNDDSYATSLADHRLLQLIAHKEVLVCGDLENILDLCGKCRRVVLAKDLIPNVLDTAHIDPVEFSMIKSWRKWLPLPTHRVYLNNSISSKQVLMALYKDNIAFISQELKESRGPVLKIPDVNENVRESLAILTYLSSDSRPIVLSLMHESERLRILVLSMKVVELKSRMVDIMAQIRHELSIWETYLSESKTWYVAETSTLSIADCAIFPVFMWLHQNGLTFDTYPCIDHYFSQMLKLSVVRRTFTLNTKIR